MVQFLVYSGNADNVQDYIERGLLDLGVMGEPVDIRKLEFENHDFISGYCPS